MDCATALLLSLMLDVCTAKSARRRLRRSPNEPAVFYGTVEELTSPSEFSRLWKSILDSGAAMDYGVVKIVPIPGSMQWDFKDPNKEIPDSAIPK